MAASIYKYQINNFNQTVEIPLGGQVLCMNNVDDKITVWVLVDPDSSINTPRRFYLTEGDVKHPGPGKDLSYIGTCQMKSSVYHLFEVIEE